MRIIGRIIMIIAVLWLILVVLGNNIDSISDGVGELTEALLPLGITIIGLCLIIRSIFR